MGELTANAGPRLDRLPIARFHWKLLALITSGSVLDTFDLYLAGGVLVAANAEGFATVDQTATFLSMTAVGMVVGSLMAGYMGDRFGRRFSYQFNLWVFGLASFAAAFAPTMDFLIVCRLIMGIGLGAEFVVAAGTLGEFIPPSHRGRWASIMGLFTSSGLMIATVVGYVVIPALGWRYMFLIAGTGAVIICLLRKQMPESPRWLESVGRIAEARAVLDSIEMQVEARKGPLPPAATSIVVAPPTPAPVSNLFRKPLRARLITASLVAIAINTSVFGLVIWLPMFITSHGASVSDSLWMTALMSFGSTAGSLIGLAVADRVPRRWTLVVTACAIAVFGLFYASSTGTVMTTVSGFLLVSSIFTLANQGTFSYVPELFPTAYRLRGTGIAGTAARLIAVLIPFAIVILFDRWGVMGVLFMIYALLAAMVVAVILLKVEARGRSLDEIDPKVLPTEVAR